MSLERRDISVSQFCELLGIEPSTFAGVKDVWYKPVPVMPQSWARKIVVEVKADGDTRRAD